MAAHSLDASWELPAPKPPPWKIPPDKDKVAAVEALEQFEDWLSTARPDNSGGFDGYAVHDSHTIFQHRQTNPSPERPWVDRSETVAFFWSSRFGGMTVHSPPLINFEAPHDGRGKWEGEQHNFNLHRSSSRTKTFTYPQQPGDEQGTQIKVKIVHPVILVENCAANKCQQDDQIWWNRVDSATLFKSKVQEVTQTQLRLKHYGILTRDINDSAEVFPPQGAKGTIDIQLRDVQIRKRYRAEKDVALVYIYRSTVPKKRKQGE